MFDSYSSNQSLNINAVSGTILKTYRNSFILRFHMSSETAHKLFDNYPVLKKGNYNRPVVVLQVMICGDKEFLAEVMWKEDFDKLFNDGVEEE